MTYRAWNPPLLSAAIAAGLALFTPAHADECGPLQRAASVDITMTPNGLPTVPLTLNGSPRKFLFGTAGGISTISKAAADSLNLQAASTRTKLVSSNGNATQQFVTVDSFTYGGLAGKDLILMISPNPNLNSPNLPVDGEITNDVMDRYDTDLDFAGNKLSYFSPDHCDGHVVYWTSAPPTVIPFRRGQPGSRNILDTHIRFHVTLDGKDVLAVLNTAIPRSQLNAKAAEAIFNVTEDSQGTVPLGNMSGRKVFGYVFKTMSFGDITVNNPHIVVIPDIVGLNDVNNAGRSDSRIKKVDDDLEPDLTIGMEVLRKLHLYIATKENKLYITAAAGPAGAPAP
jgi:Aspartyl protease